MAAEKVADFRPDIDTELVGRLVATQFPRWAGLPLRLVDPAGSDHVIHRLGEELAVRLPRHAGAIGQAEKEFRWLPRLAPHLPLALPVPVAVGEPDCGYPWPWAISRWLDGEVATVPALADSYEITEELARFLTALQNVTPEGVQAESMSEDLSGSSLHARDRAVRAAIARTGGAFDAAAMTELWNMALSAPAWEGPRSGSTATSTPAIC